MTSWYGGAGHAIYSGTKWAVSGITEALRAELAPLGIIVTVIEPGWFRTGILAKDVSAQSAKMMDVYEKGEIGELRNMLEAIDGKQVGDTAKACKVAVDVLTKSGCAEGREIPVRLVLGKDAHDVIGEKCRGTLRLLGEWEGVAAKTDFD